MKAYSEDLRMKIVDAIERRGMNKCQAARTFDVSLPTVKRYARKSRQGLSLSPSKAPGRAPKMDESTKKLLAEDVKQRPTVTLKQRREYLQAVAGIDLSRSVLCRTIKRMAWLGSYVMLMRYWNAFSKKPPPPKPRALLEWTFSGRGLYLYVR